MHTVPNPSHPTYSGIVIALVALVLRAQLAWHDARYRAAARAIARHQRGMTQTLENVAAARRTLAGSAGR